MVVIPEVCDKQVTNARVRNMHTFLVHVICMYNFVLYSNHNYPCDFMLYGYRTFMLGQFLCNYFHTKIHKMLKIPC